MRLARQLQQKPLAIAERVIAQLSAATASGPSPFKKLEASGAGFINITLTDDFLQQHLQVLINDARLGIAAIKNPQTIVVDYGGPNVAKEMHVGHLRSTIIGDALVRILDFLGNTVIRQNHVGDWGTQFGMLIEYMLQAGETHKQHSLSDLDSLYKKSKQQFDADAEFAARARARVVALQGGDPATLDTWQLLVNESKQHFQKIYQRLGVLLTDADVRGESFYNSSLPALVADLEKMHLAQISDGALVIFLEGFTDQEDKPLPFIIRKQDGAYLYATTDLAAVKFRLQQLHGSRLIYVIDARQKQHMAMLFAAAKKAGWCENVSLEHAPFGSVLGEDNRPFKTRSGESIKLSDLLDEAESRAAIVAGKKNPQLSPQQLQEIARVIGIGALKYADLRSDKVKDYVFSWEKMLAFDGNTAPYLQNAYVRIQSIFRKGNIDLAALHTAELLLAADMEHHLALKILELPQLLLEIAEDLAIQRLCDYLYTLASLFHKFYEHCPILNNADSAVRNSRLLLCDLSARTLRLGLNLLGIDVLAIM
jgi:arginyl-tRNA synthetase